MDIYKHINTLKHTYIVWVNVSTQNQLVRMKVCTATHFNTLQHTATHYNSLQHTATHYNTLQHPETPCNTLQRTATHCNTLQQTSIVHEVATMCFAGSIQHIFFGKSAPILAKPYHFVRLFLQKSPIFVGLFCE